MSEVHSAPPKVAGYLCEKAQHVPYFTLSDCTAEHAKLQGWTVTAIHSALAK